MAGKDFVKMHDDGVRDARKRMIRLAILAVIGNAILWTGAIAILLSLLRLFGVV